MEVIRFFLVTLITVFLGLSLLPAELAYAEGEGVVSIIYELDIYKNSDFLKTV